MGWRDGKIDRNRWRKVRADILSTANWRCNECGGYGNEVDHIGGHDAGLYDPSNLQVLCRTHHIEKTRAENRTVIPGRDEWSEHIKELEGKGV